MTSSLILDPPVIQTLNGGYIPLLRAVAGGSSQFEAPFSTVTNQDGWVPLAGTRVRLARLIVSVDVVIAAGGSFIAVAVYRDTTGAGDLVFFRQWTSPPPAGGEAVAKITTVSNAGKQFLDDTNSMIVSVAAVPTGSDGARVENMTVGVDIEYL